MVSSEGFENRGGESTGVAAARAGHSCRRSPTMRPAMGLSISRAPTAGDDRGRVVRGDGRVPGIYASVMQPAMIAREVFDVPGTKGLDGVETAPMSTCSRSTWRSSRSATRSAPIHPALGLVAAWLREGGATTRGRDRTDSIRHRSAGLTTAMRRPTLLTRLSLREPSTAGSKREHGPGASAI